MAKPQEHDPAVLSKSNETGNRRPFLLGRLCTHRALNWDTTHLLPSHNYQHPTQETHICASLHLREDRLLDALTKFLTQLRISDSFDTSALHYTNFRGLANSSCKTAILLRNRRYRNEIHAPYVCLKNALQLKWRILWRTQKLRRRHRCHLYGGLRRKSKWFLQL